MATTPATPSLQRGGAFLIASTAPEEIFTPADLSDDQRLIGQTAEEFVPKEVVPAIPELELHKEGLMAQMLKKAGEIGLLGGGVPEEYGGSGLDKVSSTVHCGKTFDLRIVWRQARRPRRHRHPAHRLFRHRRAKEKISAEDRDRRKALLLLPLGAAGRLGRAELAHARRAFARRQKLDPERPENVDHQRRLCRRVHRLRESGRRKIFLLHRRARLSRLFRRRRRKKDGHCAAAPPRRSFSRTCQVPKENLLHEIGRGHIVAFNILNAGRFTLGAYCIGGSKQALIAASKYAKERIAFGKQHR